MATLDMFPFCIEYANNYYHGNEVSFVDVQPNHPDIYTNDMLPITHQVGLDISMVKDSFEIVKDSVCTTEIPLVQKMDDYSNTTQSPISQEFSFTFTNEETSSTQLTETVTVSKTVDISASVSGDVFGLSASKSMSFTLDTSSTEIKTISKKVEEMLKFNYDIQPNTSGQVVFTAKKVEYSGDWTAVVKVSGNFAYWSWSKFDSGNGLGESNLQVFPISAPFRDRKNRGFAPVPYNVVIDGDSILVTIKGKLNGVSVANCKLIAQ